MDELSDYLRRRSHLGHARVDDQALGLAFLPRHLPHREPPV